MNLTQKLFFPPLLCLLSLGCSGGDKPAPQASQSADKSAPTSPIAAAAHDFLDAVFKNDLARATQRLTPQAIQNLDAQDQRFSWGSDATKLEIGEVRQVSDSEAAVQCLVTESAGAKAEELVCMLRNVQGQWRVCKLIGENPQNGQPLVMDFEAPPARDTTPSTPTSGGRYAEGPAPQIPDGNLPSGGLPQTAAGPTGSAVR